MTLFKLIMMRVMTAFYGILTVLHLLRLTFRHGYSATWGRRERSVPECLSDPGLGTHSYITVNDVKLHYVISGPEDKPLMLFLHGFPEFWFSWRHQIREFQTDYRVVAIDQRGYSDSDKPDGVENYKVSKLMSDVSAVIQGLGYKTCVLVTHDWGGAVGFAFSRFFPDMVDKLIVMNAPSQPSFAKLLETHRTQQKNSWYIFFFQLPYLPELSMRARDLHCFDSLFGKIASEDEIAAYKYTFSQPRAWTPPINWYRAAFGLKAEIRYDMEFQMPVLLIWGVKDTALHIDLVAQMEKDCPKMEVKRIPEAGHFVQMDAPRDVNRIMREWLERSDTRSRL